MSSPEWISRGWVLLLSLTVALLAVMALRPWCRRWLGPERAFRLWLLPPLALLVCQLPHPAGVTSRGTPHVVVMLGNVAHAVDGPRASDAAIQWQSVVLAVWLLGVVLGAALSMVAQWRYLKLVREGSGSTESEGITVWRSRRNDVGPALVGAWHPRIVVPADFEHRYTEEERALILAHEQAHAARRDGWWALLARLTVIAGWCHPFAWWAYGAFRLDQELACDALVMQRHRRHRQAYAHAMLKTQSAAFALPVGCSWSPRHPITERIAMLSLSPPGRIRRLAGHVALLTVGFAVAGSLYAASDKPVTADGSHRLKIELALNGEPARLHANVCLKKDGHYEALQHTDDPMISWHVVLRVEPAAGGQLRVNADVTGGPVKEVAHPAVGVLPGQTGTIQMGEKAIDNKGNIADHTLLINVTPYNGC